MGIEYQGFMLIGEKMSNISIFINQKNFDWDKWIEENNFEMADPYFDCDMEDRYIGFKIEDIPIKDINNEWLDNLKLLGKKFEELTDTSPKLIGILNIF